MKFYIDFDHTLYNTNALITDMINCIAEYILNNGNFEEYPKNFMKLFPNIKVISVKKDINSITQLLMNNFGRLEDTVLKLPYNIFSLTQKFGQLFDYDYTPIKLEIDKIIDNGQKYLYNDSIDFLIGLKQRDNEVYILSHNGSDLEFQEQKIKGSGIVCNNLLNAAIITKESKAELTSQLIKDISKTNIFYADSNSEEIELIDYDHGIFIDDRPKDLEKLYSSVYKNEYPPFKIRIYRMSRENGTYSKLPLSIKVTSGIKEIKNFFELIST